MSEQVTVLGAGMVGVSCALELQRQGFQVRLLDRRGPGEETSYGNAGLLSFSNITPIADPALWRRLPRLALNLENDLLLHYAHLPWLLPWIARFLANCRRGPYLDDGARMYQLVNASIELHHRWIDEAGATGLMNYGGALKLFRRRRSFERQALEHELLQHCGVRFSELDAQQAYELEPGLRRIFERAVLVEDTVSIRDPGKLCQHYARLFGDAGGEVVRAEVGAIRAAESGWEVTTHQGVEPAERLVVCLGAWTPALLAPLGYANPLAIERGYHMMFSAQGDARLSRPIFDVDASYVMAPMEAGLRVSTGTNLVYRDTRIDARQLGRVVPCAREAFPLGQALLDQPWMGRRPTLPDTLPIIGPAPAHENLWLAFGHSHMGFTLGPITGRLIANAISGAPQPVSPAACAPSRYL